MRQDAGYGHEDAGHGHPGKEFIDHAVMDTADGQGWQKMVRYTKAKVPISYAKIKEGYADIKVAQAQIQVSERRQS